MNNAFWRTLPLLLLLAFAAAFAHPATAQGDPPGRVARLSYMQGSISYQVSGDQDWVQADPNRPLTTGDNLWADKDSRGEVHIGSTAIRLSSETGISFLTLDDRTAQIQLAQGAIKIHLRDLTPGDDYEIDTPNLAFTLTRSGEYLISTDPDDNRTTIAVREGEGQVTGGGDSWILAEGHEYIFSGTDQLTYDAQPLEGFDDFETWCQDRDQRENDSVSARYVSRDVDGYYDLDNYGQWESDSDYGEVWVPTVAAGWAPYRMGQWVYIAPWGWTWVDDEPWGFAPFHYGRWFFVGSHWAWIPGPRVVRPVYAPALVGFVGGSGFGISLSFGGGTTGVAWFPLGPRDVYVPGYRCSAHYVQNINITNTRVVNAAQVTRVYNTVVIDRNVTRVNYTYARNDRAVTAVQHDTFVNARPVSQGMLRVNAQQIERARVIESGPIAPTRASYFSASARVSNFRPAVPISRRAVVVRLNPAVSHSNRGGAYTNDSRQFNQPSAPHGAVPHPEPAPANTANRNEQPSREGFHPFGPPSRGNQTQAPVEKNQRPAEQPGNRGNQDSKPPLERQQPEFRYAPPVKANDKMYDVHPPLNQKQNRTQAPPRPQKKRSAPPAHQQKDNRGSHDDSKHH
ncbi:MAG: DUF6600 domain-containing protein [Candidatus Acidiferrales bacterium]